MLKGSFLGEQGERLIYLFDYGRLSMSRNNQNHDKKVSGAHIWRGAWWWSEDEVKSRAPALIRQAILRETNPALLCSGVEWAAGLGKAQVSRSRLRRLRVRLARIG